MLPSGVTFRSFFNVSVLTFGIAPQAFVVRDDNLLLPHNRWMYISLDISTPV